MADKKKVSGSGRKAVEKTPNGYQELFNRIRDGYARVDMEGTIIESNPAFRDMLGYSDKELAKLSYEDITPERWHEEEAKVIQEQVLKRGFSDIYEKEYIRKDKSVFPIEIVTYLTSDEKGMPESMWAFVRDISEKRRAEEAIEYRMEFERLIATISSDFINVPADEVDNEIGHVLQLLGEFAGVDRCYIFQFSSDGDTMSNTHEWCAEDIQPMIEHLKDVPRQAFEWSLKMIEKNEVVHVPRVADLGPEAQAEKEEFEREGIKSMIIVPMVYSDTIIGFIGFDSVKMEKGWADDIIGLMRLTGETIGNALERKTFEVVLRENEEKFRTLAEQSPNMIFINHMGRIVYANQKSEEVMGYKREELYSPDFNFLSLIAPSSLDTVKDSFAKHAAGKDVDPYEYSLLTKRGDEIRAIVTSKLIDYEGGRAILGIVTDISEQALILDALKVSEEKFRTLFESSRDPVFITTRDGNFVELNQAGIDLLGYPMSELREMNVAELYRDPKDRARFISEIESRGFVRDFEIQLDHKKGAVVDCLLTATLRTGDDGESTWYQGVIRDVTESKAAEKALRESEEGFRNIVNSTPIGMHIYALSDDGRLVFVGANRTADDILGVDNQQFIGKTIEEAFPPLDGTEIPDMYRRAAGNGIPWRTEHVEYQDDRIAGAFEVHAFQTSPGVMVAAFTDITERKQAEEALRESEAKYRAAIEQSPNGIFIMNPETRKVTEWNAAFQGFIGYDDNEMDDLMIYSFIDHPKDDIDSKIEDLLAERSKFIGERSYIRKDGTKIDVEVSGVVIPVGGQDALCVVSKDITERKRVNVAIMESEEKYRSLFEEAKDGIVLIDVETGVIVDCNSEFERQTGRDYDSLCGMRIWELRPEDKVDAARKTFFRIAKEGQGGSAELDFLQPGGALVPIEFESTKVSFGGKEYMQSMTRDITERMKADQTLRRSERFYRTTIDSMIDPLHVVDTDLRIVLHNDRFTEWTSGLGIEGPFMDRKLPDIFPFLPPTVWEEYNQVIDGREPLGTNEDNVIDGRRIITETSKIPVVEGGEVTRVITVLHDVTERKRSEIDLMESEERYRNLFDASPEAIVIIDSEGKIMDYNAATSSIAIFPKEDIRGRSFADLDFVEEDRIDDYFEMFLQLLEGEDIGPIEVKIDTGEGRTWLEIFPGLITKGGQVSGLELICRDITLRKRAEKVIRDSLAEKEVMLKEIHHRVKNNMQVISSMINLQAGYIDEDAMRSVFNESQNRVRSMALIHDKLYQSKDLSRINFYEYIESLGTHLMQSYGVDPNKIRFDVHGEPIFIGIDRGVPAGLIVNELISNSLKHAFPEGQKGRIEVTLADDGGMMALRIKDNGSGIPEEIDFRNTETLGLELVTTLVSQLEGEIDLDRKKGTSFNIVFKIEEETGDES